MFCDNSHYGERESSDLDSECGPSREPTGIRDILVHPRAGVICLSWLLTPVKGNSGALMCSYLRPANEPALLVRTRSLRLQKESET